jgi:hypothetical protein
MLNAIIYPTKDVFISSFFYSSFCFLFCIAKELAICKVRGVLSAKIFIF